MQKKVIVIDWNVPYQPQLNGNHQSRWVQGELSRDQAAQSYQKITKTWMQNFSVTANNSISAKGTNTFWHMQWIYYKTILSIVYIVTVTRASLLKDSLFSPATLECCLHAMVLYLAFWHWLATNPHFNLKSFVCFLKS